MLGSERASLEPVHAAFRNPLLCGLHAWPVFGWGFSVRVQAASWGRWRDWSWRRLARVPCSLALPAGIFWKARRSLGGGQTRRSRVARFRRLQLRRGEDVEFPTGPGIPRVGSQTAAGPDGYVPRLRNIYVKITVSTF